MKSKTFLKEYLNAYSPVGNEEEGQKIWSKRLFDIGVKDIKIDSYGTAFGYISNNSNYNVIIEAHCDEIAWIITYIQDDGYIRVKRHGGSDKAIAPSKSVIIHTHTGKKIQGVFGSPAIHVKNRTNETIMEEDDLWLDVGLSSKKEILDIGIEVGCVVTFDDKFKEIGDYYVARAIDNKIGGYIISEATKRILDEKIILPYNLIIINAVQEEVGLFGATRIAKRFTSEKSIAIVHDVTHATNHPKIDKAKEGDIKSGSGIALQYTTQNHKGIIKKLREIADKNDLKYQLSVGSYGNDTVSFFKENISTAIISTPIKYMHTTVEMAHKDDVETAIKLYVEFLKNITIDDIADWSVLKHYK